MGDWTSAEVEEHLRRASAIGAALSEAARPIQGHAMGHEDRADIGIIGGIGPAHRDTDIGTAVEARSWLRMLDPEDAGLVLARLNGARWKMICWRFGISRPTAHRRWRHALGLIAWRLNGNVVPARCSRRRFMKLADRR